MDGAKLSVVLSHHHREGRCRNWMPNNWMIPRETDTAHHGCQSPRSLSGPEKCDVRRPMNNGGQGSLLLDSTKQKIGGLPGGKPLSLGFAFVLVNWRFGPCPKLH